MQILAQAVKQEDNELLCILLREPCQVGCVLTHDPLERHGGYGGVGGSVPDLEEHVGEGTDELPGPGVTGGEETVHSWTVEDTLEQSRRQRTVSTTPIPPPSPPPLSPVVLSS